MEVIANNNDIHLVLKELIDRKSERDNLNFTVYQLAKLIGMPHSILIKLMHEDPSKRVNNPRIDTLTRIVDFFRRDGFNVTLNDFLTGFNSNAGVSVDEQEVGISAVETIIPAYSFDTHFEKKLGTVEVMLPSASKNVIALISDHDIKPMFKKGSIFIVDMGLLPEDDTLVAVRLDGMSNILIRKLHIVNNIRTLKSYNENEPPIKIVPTKGCRILGVVIQVNART
ncbi:MAG: S24 family peptidase [Gammaproteobacteria bacterium]